MHNADVGVHHDAEGVGSQIAQSGFRITDQAIAALVVIGERDGALGNDLGDGVGEGALNVCDVCRNGLVLCGVVLGRDQLGGDCAVGCDGQLAESRKLAAFLTRFCEDNLFAFLVGNLRRDGLVVMTVEHGVDAGGVGDDSLGGPSFGDAFVAEMRQRDDILGARFSCCVNGFLHGFIESRAVIVFAEGVDVVTLRVLEICGGRLDKGFRRRDADVGNLGSAVVNDFIRLVVQLRRAGAEILEVAGEVFKLCLLAQLDQLGNLVVIFMVAEGREIVADLIHDVDQIRAAGECADRLALNRVAAVDKRDIVVSLQHFGLVGGNARVAHAIGYAAVNVVGVQDDNVVGFCVCRECRGPETENHYQAKQKCK